MSRSPGFPLSIQANHLLVLQEGHSLASLYRFAVYKEARERGGAPLDPTPNPQIYLQQNGGLCVGCVPTFRLILVRFIASSIKLTFSL